MITWKEYFEFAAALMGIYAVFRVFIWLGFRNDFREVDMQSERSGMENHPIDTSHLAERVEEVRRDHAAEAQAHPGGGKKPLLVAERRAEIAKLGFFQRPPPEPEPPEQEHGLVLFTL